MVIQGRIAIDQAVRHPRRQGRDVKHVGPKIFVVDQLQLQIGQVPQENILSAGGLQARLRASSRQTAAKPPASRVA
jgi:hypothetical protein